MYPSAFAEFPIFGEHAVRFRGASLKRCPSFSKTMPFLFQNEDLPFPKRCPSFFLWSAGPEEKLRRADGKWARIATKLIAEKRMCHFAFSGAKLVTKCKTSGKNILHFANYFCEITIRKVKAVRRKQKVSKANGFAYKVKARKKDVEGMNRSRLPRCPTRL